MRARLQSWLQRLGPVGIAGVGLLLCCLAFYLSSLRPNERLLDAERIVAEQARARLAVQPAGLGDADDLSRFYAAFPPTQQLPDELERLYGYARAAHIELMQGEYRLEKRGPGPVPYRITLPVRGGYPQIREFIGATLQNMPYASVDGLRFERKNVGDAQIEAQLRLTLYFRPSA